MARRPLAALLAAALFPLVTSSAGAQSRDDSMFYPGNPRGYLGFFLNGFGGYYSNGFSMYGPPVPTYAPVPGVFGGSDARFWAPGPGFAGLGVSLPLGRAKHRPEIPYPPGGPGRVASRLALPVTVDVRVPDPSADVWFDGRRTQQTGTTRLFESPPLPWGKTFDYEVTATWMDGATPVLRRRTVSVRAGGRATIDFGQPDEPTPLPLPRLEPVPSGNAPKPDGDGPALP